MKFATRAISVASVSLFLALAFGADDQTPRTPEIPRVWDERALRDGATPVAGLNARPGHISETEYYRLPIEDLRTYPVYYPGREPAGRTVFEESDAPQLRTTDPRLIAKVRSREFYEEQQATANIPSLRVSVETTHLLKALPAFQAARTDGA
jgi:hypothetical protein